jgi:PPOX class probable F420-dependent enzyme
VRLDPAEARRRISAAAIARLATVTPDHNAHVVPVCFAVVDESIYWAVDDKPKSRAQLQRLANLAANASAALLVDHYDEDWTELWWARADGDGREITGAAERRVAVDALRARYRQYTDHALDDAVIAIDVRAWSGWSAAGTRPAPGR